MNGHFRDPRVDPLPGDIISKLSSWGIKLKRIVTKRYDHEVYYCASDDSAELHCLDRTWKEWAKDSQIEYIAE